ncbi:MAG: hypothetical protein JWQ66_3059 [Mucilaginibacter sp.]|nr:hypothetical protein [Mucilaginibacter sp.]
MQLSSGSSFLIKKLQIMEWYNYLAIFFSGAFLSNAIPHFVNGMSGDKFPTPFAKPPGQGLSSPVLNVAWAGLNIVIGVVLLKAGKLQTGNALDLVVFFAGFMAMALMLAGRFSTKHKE